MTKPVSYPFLAIAKQFGLDYGDVLLVADMWRHPAQRNDVEREADKRLYLAIHRHHSPRDIVRIEKLISGSNAQFKAIQAGEIDWLTGEPRAEETHEFGYTNN